MNTNLLEKFDAWLQEESKAVALVSRQYLVPVEGRDAVIFPPTYAPPEGFRGEWPGYNIDTFPDGSSVCLIDSVGSQANRLEPMFKHPPYHDLVPQVVVKIRTKGGQDIEVNILDAGHRAGDAVVRYSQLAAELSEAFKKLAQGDALPLARLAPTSLIFGVWDSRGTQVKVSRLVRSVIRAYNVRPLHRSATYVPPVMYEEKGVLETISDKIERDRRAEEGLVHNPASWSPGGVQVLGEIRRDAMCNLVQLRNFSSTTEEPMVFRRYLLGLALVAFTAFPETNLREGCELELDPEHPAQNHNVYRDGQREPLTLTHEEALEFAREAAKAFGLPHEPRTVAFEPERLMEALKKSKEERKKGQGI
ncbi:MAG: type I-G CRISPR-associated RAMP protein Csb1/Cas7g [Thermoanaerobaculum sp.]